MQRATYVRIHGDKPIGNAIADGVEFNVEAGVIKDLEEQLKEAHQRIRQLEAQLGVAAFAQSKQYRQKIDELNRKYPNRPHSKFYDKMLVLIGTLWLIHTEGEIS